jgi:hypothetical protein
MLFLVTVEWLLLSVRPLYTQVVKGEGCFSLLRCAGLSERLLEALSSPSHLVQ